MFRTGHRTDHTAWVEPAPEPRIEPPAPAADEPALPEAPIATAAPRATTEFADAMIGRGVTFDGSLRFSGTMRMDGGAFSGKITAGDRLIVGDGATLEAAVTCGSIEVRGEAHGSLTASESVELHSPARVSADVSAPSLVIDRGVLFEGTVQMHGAATAARPARRKSAETQ